MFTFRSQTLDPYIFYQVVHQNEYKLKDDLSDKIIIDIGSHIGSFSIACLQRNAKYVYAYEAHPENYQIAKNNILKVSDKAIVENLAVIGSEQNEKVSYNDLSFNTGQHRISDNIYGDKLVNTIKFDKIINSIVTKHSTKVHLVKLDCEGSEYPILYTSLCLYSIENIVGEYHDDVPLIDIDEDNHFQHNGEGFMEFLKHSGFMVFKRHMKNTGLFFATRKLSEAPFLIPVDKFS